MLNFVPLTEKYLDEISSWFKNDEAVSRYIESYKRPEELFKLALNNANRYCWIAKLNSELIGIIELEIKGQTGFIAFAVKPKARGFGMSKEMLTILEKQPEVAKLNLLKASVEDENIASQKTLVSSGYVTDGTDKDNLIVFVKTLSK
jgi:predicted acetyltransferase